MRTAVALVTLLAVLSACGGDDAGRPTAAELAAALTDPANPVAEAFLTGGAEPESLDCVAEALHGSDLSDEALRALVDGDEGFAGDQDDNAVLNSGELTSSISGCLAG